MTLATRYAAEASKRLSICQVAPAVSQSRFSASTSRRFGELLIYPEDRAARAVVFDLLGRDAL
jgi:hypothetical protein